MPKERPPTILCVSSYEKGQEFMRTCKREGWDVFLLTMEKLRDADWPREAITEAFYIPEELPLQGLINAVSYMARSRPIDRIVALDEFDMENVAALREHLRIPGMGQTTMRYFRDKLAMRGRAKEEGIAVPEFVHVLNYDDLRDFMARVKPPWLLKPRSQASGIGMKKINHESELWPWLDQLGDQQSFYLLEQFVPGDVFHVDSMTAQFILSKWPRALAERTSRTRSKLPPESICGENGLILKWGRGKNPMHCLRNATVMPA